MRLVFVAGFVSLVGLSVGAGYLLGGLHAQPVVFAAPAVVHERESANAPVIVAGSRGLSEDELRRVVREELAAGSSAHPAAAPAPAARAADPAVLETGMQRVTAAIARRLWTHDDAIALGHTLEAATSEQRTEILHTLIPALNRGEIKLNYRGEPF